MTAADPLLTLVVDTAEVDRARIADALRGVIVIDKSGAVVPANGFQLLSAQQKVIALLLGRKVAVLLGLSTDEAVGPKDLAKRSAVAEGTVYPTVRRLLTDRAISQDGDGRYHLSTHQVRAAIDRLESETSPEPGSAPSRPRKTVKKTKAKVAKKTSAQGTPTKPSPKKRSSTAFSPAGAVRELVEQGFLDKPKGLGAVQQRLKDKKGRDVKLTTLSPVFTRLLRNGTLDREKNDDGAYEYVRANG